jgi:two-component system sensor histidine kinase UhpB
MTAKPSLPPWSGPLAGLAYFLGWLLLMPTQQPYWVLSFGLRFGVLLLAPLHAWPWILGAELAAGACHEASIGLPLGWLGYLLGDVPEPLVVAACLWLLRHTRLQPSLQDPEAVSRLLLSAMLAVLATTAAEALLLAAIHAAPSTDLMVQGLGQDLLGNYVGMLLVTPVLIMLARAQPARPALARLAMDGLRVFVPSLAGLMVLSGHGIAPQPFARVLALAPVLYFAFRHGWRGASVSMLVSSLGLALVDRAPPTAAAYLFLAVAGTGALMLGSASDALRRSGEQVAAQNAYLAAANERLDQLTRQLRDAARGNLHAEENQRRHMAAELHDELGQNLTAIQTHLKLAQAQLQRAGLEGLGVSINGILAHMRRALHRLLDNLRPAVLDEFGLLRALDEGPVRDLLAAAGIAYRTDLRGNPRLLDDDTRTAIYRVVQESATNAVKHAQASEFSLRLRIGERNGQALALLDIRDDGQGLPDSPPRGGRGLRGMHDRVTSLGGLFRVRPVPRGTRLRVLLKGSNSPLADPLPLETVS